MKLDAYLSPLERSRLATMREVEAGRISAWTMDTVNGAATRDRLTAAKDRRARFAVVDGGLD